jgi:hypothetical protein
MKAREPKPDISTALTVPHWQIVHLGFRSIDIRYRP